MGRFEQEGRCPDCGADCGSAETCPVCGLVLIGADADALRQLLAQADVIVDRLRPVVVDLPPAPPDPGAEPTPLVPTPQYPAGWPPVAARRTASISTSAVLLGLGAVCFVVAAVVFVSVSWSDLSLAARAAILLGVTATMGAIAGWADRRRLKGSTETFALLFAVFVVVDFVAAHAGGLAGLDSLSDQATSWTAATLAVGVGAASALAARRTFPLYTVQVVMVVGLLWWAGMALADWSWRGEYVAFVIVAVMAGLTWCLRRLGLDLAAAGAVALATVSLVAATMLALERMLDSSSLRSLWVEGDAYGWLACCAVAACLAMWSRGRPRLGIVAAGCCLAGLTALLLRPLGDADRGAVALAGAAAAVVLTMGWVGGSGVWGRGARGAATLPALVAAAALEPAVSLAAATVTVPAIAPWTVKPGSYPDVAGLDAGPSVVAVTVSTIALLLAGRFLWRKRVGGLDLAVVAVLAAVLGIDVGLLTLRIPLEAVVLVLLASSVGVAALAAARREPAVATTAVVLAGLALFAALGSVLLTALAALALAVLASACVLLARTTVVQGLAARGGVLVTGLSAAAWSVVAGGQESAAGITLVAVAAVAALVAQLGVPWAARLRPGVEPAAVVVAVVGLALTAHEPFALEIALTTAGATAVLVSLWSGDRRSVGIVGGFLLAAATWVRLVDEQVTLVEAYTLPTAAVLLVVGARTLSRHPELSSRATLLPGLSLAMLPSLLRTLAEPTSVRALVLGVFALASVLIGARWRLAAPLLLGAGVVAVLAVINLGPVALALPRWLLLAAAGSALAFLGVTWERRIQDLGALGTSIDRLR